MGIRKGLLTIVWYSEVGRAKVITRAYGMIPEILMVFTFLKVYGFNMTPVFIGIFIIIAVLISIGLGWLYLKLDFMNIENDLNNTYNRAIQEILKNTRK